MIKLDEEIVFTGEGYQTSPRFLKQVERKGNIAIYSRSDDKDRRSYCYEVIIIGSVAAGFVWPNGTVEPEGYEFYPGAKAWGKSGWTFNKLSAAKNKMKELLIKKESVKENIVSQNNNSATKIEGQFTIKEYAESAGLSYIDARSWVLANCKAVGQRKAAGRGKPSVLYAKN